MQSRRLRLAPDAESAAFGALLSRLRIGKTATVERANGRRLGGVVRYSTTAPLSQAELARRAGVDPAVVSKLEAGTYGTARRVTVERLAAALDLDAVWAARLLVAAGYWPWHDLDETAARFVAQTALALIAGDDGEDGTP